MKATNQAVELSAIELAIFLSRVEAICQEMGSVLRQAALSPNIKDRLDFSCALFDGDGELFAQAAHIPVHLGSMAYAMRDLVKDIDWQPGDALLVNDPYLGGTHLPDVTLIAPAFLDGQLLGFVANRAHHANIGASTPGSMPISTSLDEEGIVIPPTLIARGGEPVQSAMQTVAAIADGDLAADLQAQMSANRVGVLRLCTLVSNTGAERFFAGIKQVNDYGERVARSVINGLPAGRYEFADFLDDDGCGTKDIAIRASLEVGEQGVHVDFTGTSPAVRGNLNCPLSVAAAAVFYALRCILPEKTPACAGAFKCVTLSAPAGCLVNAERPAAVAAGNVETSMRIVDVVLGALGQALPGLMPAASQGTMNNIAMGNHKVNRRWDYYETMAGGTGGHPDAPGVSCVHSHMTNTLNTPIESIEMHYPLRVLEYSRRQDSGGQGARPGGDGLCRELEFLEPAEVTLITDRRSRAPWGTAGGEPGAPGRNLLDGKEVPGKCQLSVQPGQRLRIESPGGGGHGSFTGSTGSDTAKVF
ncbi:MAG: hydantoinase B/oxoprolinase family protein [Pseudomonadales bacterium]